MDTASGSTTCRWRCRRSTSEPEQTSGGAARKILVATTEGPLAFDVGGDPGPVELDGHDVTFLAPERGDAWAVVDGSELWRWSGDDGWRQ